MNFKLGLDNTNDSIRWCDKFKSVGINHLICNKTGNMVSVNVV